MHSFPPSPTFIDSTKFHPLVAMKTPSALVVGCGKQHFHENTFFLEFCTQQTIVHNVARLQYQVQLKVKHAPFCKCNSKSDLEFAIA
uniref:Uncharacterized protein n=1 Tax=Nelumbo nucifera TaxID=4432 RepID=A0A822YXB3_NELNU|nr:TPA_asm: hypothetical protein HUJ06_012719 [Nelumbo nucifera]